MGIILLSGLSQYFPGKAWLRVAVLDNPYNFFFNLGGQVG